MLYICQKYTFLITIMECLVFKNLKYQIQNPQRSGKKENLIYETYKNTVMPHGNHIYEKASDMAKAIMCEYTHSDNTLPHFKRVIQCCAKCKIINLSDQKTYNQYSNTSPSIRFQIYHILSRCSTHRRLTLNGIFLSQVYTRFYFRTIKKKLERN